MHLHHQKTGAVGRPTKHCLYAVFGSESEEDARQAEQALTGRNIEVQRPQWMEQAWNHSLRTMDVHGVMDALHDVLHEFRVELYALERYVDHSAQGRVVLVACGVDSATVPQTLALLMRYGAYDITYFGDWAVTYFSPAALGDASGDLTNATALLVRSGGVMPA